jgi:hypothetical protein
LVIREIHLDGIGRCNGFEDQAGIEERDRRAVLRRAQIQVTHGSQAGGAGHVLYDDIRIARDLAPEMAGHETGILVIAAADRIADHEIDRLASEE